MLIGRIFKCSDDQVTAPRMLAGSLPFSAPHLGKDDVV